MAKNTQLRSSQPSGAVAQLENQIETIRREAYDAGYSAAMRAVVEFTAGTAKSVAAPVPSAERRARSQVPRSAGRSSPAAKPVTRRKTSRGDNAKNVAESLAGLPERTGPAAAIRKGLSGKGIDMPYTSIRHALGQLEARGEVSLAADGKTWTYTRSVHPNDSTG